MTTVFVLRNQDHLYFDKHGEWTDGGDSSGLYRTPHKDEALNQKLELTVRSPDLRITLVNCQLNDKGRPSLYPAPEPEPLSQPECGSASEPDTDGGADADLEPLPLQQDFTGEPA